jgi:hypothetical protein
MNKFRATWPVAVAKDDAGAMVRTSATAATNRTPGWKSFETVFMTSTPRFSIHRVFDRECWPIVPQSLVLSNSGCLKNVLIAMNGRKSQKTLVENKVGNPM